MKDADEDESADEGAVEQAPIGGEEEVMDTEDDGEDEEEEASPEPKSGGANKPAAAKTAASLPSQREKRKHDESDHTAASPAKVAKSSGDKPRAATNDGSDLVAPVPPLHKSPSSSSRVAAAVTPKTASKVSRLFLPWSSVCCFIKQLCRSQLVLFERP